MGGTFDHLHDGHKYLIKTALLISNQIVIGLASNDLIKKKKHLDKIQSYDFRKQKIFDYVSEFAETSRVSIIELKDPYGPPIHEADYEGIIVSEETYEGAKKINQIRKNKGFPPLIIVVIPLLKNEKNQKISSTVIREHL
jgi:pantetheine-phosphate adenylyltransferase